MGSRSATVGFMFAVVTLPELQKRRAGLVWIWRPFCNAASKSAIHIPPGAAINSGKRGTMGSHSNTRGSAAIARACSGFTGAKCVAVALNCAGEKQQVHGRGLRRGQARCGARGDAYRGHCRCAERRNRRRGHNLIIAASDPTGHAEIIAIRQACLGAKSERLPGYDLYATLEPCAMCAAAISFARIRRLYFGAADEKGGAVEHGVRFFSSPTCHHAPEVYGGIGEARSAALLHDFFRKLRA